MSGVEECLRALENDPQAVKALGLYVLLTEGRFGAFRLADDGSAERVLTPDQAVKIVGLAAGDAALKRATAALRLAVTKT